MIEALLASVQARDDIDPRELNALEGLAGETDKIAAKHVMVKRGEPLERSVLLTRGLMCRYKDLRNGRRQISALHIAGDFVDLHGFTLKKLDHSVMALTECRVVYVPHTRLEQLTADYPHLTRLLWLLTNVDAAIHREWELSLGQRTGPARAAQLFCELHARMEVVGLVRGPVFDLRINQSELGECLGMTGVHANRVLRALRERGLADFRDGVVTLLDPAGLRRLADFDPAYLYIEKRTR